MDINIQRKIEKMKYLLKFNESYLDPTLSENDQEIVENCFLDYIDEGQCRIFHGPYIVSLYFLIPQDLVAGQTNEDKSSLYKWVETFIRGLSNHVKRCESYGYICGFHLRDLNHGKLTLWVFKKVFIEQLKNTKSSNNPNRVVLSYDEILKSISEIILSFS